MVIPGASGTFHKADTNVIPIPLTRPHTATSSGHSSSSPPSWVSPLSTSFASSCLLRSWVHSTRTEPRRLLAPALLPAGLNLSTKRPPRQDEGFTRGQGQGLSFTRADLLGALYLPTGTTTSEPLVRPHSPEDRRGGGSAVSITSNIHTRDFLHLVAVSDCRFAPSVS